MRIFVEEYLGARGYQPTRTVALVDRGGRLVVRVDTDAGRLVVKAEPGPAAFAADVAAIRRLAAAGLPVPSVVAPDIGPPSCLVMRWVDGTGLTSTADLSVHREAGRLLRRVHSVGGGPPYGGCGTWQAWMRGWLSHAVTWWQASGRGDRRRIDALWAWYSELEPLLATRGGELILFDGRPDHFIVDDERVAAIIDVAEVRSGDAAMDFAVLAVTEPELLAGVLDGYAPTDAERQVFDRLVPFYLVLRRLAAAEWNTTHGDPNVVRFVLDTLDDAPLRP